VGPPPVDGIVSTSLIPRPLHPTGVGQPIAGLASLLLALAGLAAPALAQSETFMLQPGSKVGPATKVKPTNCVTAPDGSVTCDTTIENAPGDTPAKPLYQPFKN
jgi:hypothetical protein